MRAAERRGTLEGTPGVLLEALLLPRQPDMSSCTAARCPDKGFLPVPLPNSLVVGLREGQDTEGIVATAHGSWERERTQSLSGVPVPTTAA